MFRIDSPCDFTTRENLINEATRLEALASDIRQIAFTAAPTTHALRSAPILRGWRLADLNVPCLVGVTSGHPRLRAGQIHTTEVLVINESAGWARTVSRFYKLASPSRSRMAEEYPNE